MNRFEAHALRLGKLVGNLQSIELAARLALTKLQTPARLAEAETELPRIRQGDRVTKSAITNSDDLSRTLQKYNKRVPLECRVAYRQIVGLRDALAHGRTFGSGAPGEGPLRLLKFSRESDRERKVEVTMAADMTAGSAFLTHSNY